VSIGESRDLEFAGFIKELFGELEIAIPEPSPSLLLDDDCGVDSIGMYEILVLLEDRIGEISEEAIMECRTLGDLYFLAQEGLAPSVIEPNTQA
jgi:acyl carrier protein